MKKTKLMSILLAVTMATTLLVGCGGGKAEDPAPVDEAVEEVEETEDEVAEDEVAEEPGEIVNLKWYTFTAQPQPDLEKVNEAINEYIAEEIGVTVDITMIPGGDYNDKMQAMTNAGGDFDIAFTSGWTNNYDVNAKKGAFLALDDLLKEEGKDVYDAVNPMFWDATTVEGHIYGVPAQKEIQASAGVIMPKKYIDKYDIDTSKINSVADLEDYLAIIKENEPDATPWYIEHHIGYDFAFHNLVNANVPVAIEMAKGDDMVVVNKHATDTAKELFDTLHDYYQKGYINQDAATLPGLGVMDMKDKDFGVFQIETGPGQEGYLSEAVGQEVEYIELWDTIAKGNSGASQAISSQSKHPKEAMKFLNLLNTDPVLRNMLSYGIEDVHYEKVSENVIKTLPAADSWQVPQYTFGNMLITYTMENEPEDKWEQFIEFNDGVTRSPAFGFEADIESFENEIAAVTNAQEEFINILTTGSVDPDKYVAELNEKLEAAGINKIIEEVQKQLDEWVAENK